MAAATDRTRWTSKNVWGLSKIVTREDALRTIKSASNAFFLAAALQLTVILILGQYAAVGEVALIAIDAFLLRRYASRSVAVTLLGLALADAGFTVADEFLGVMVMGRTTFILTAILLWAAVRGVQATFKLHRLSEGRKLFIGT